MNRRTLALFELPFFALALATTFPLLAVAHPAIQDLPQHLATIRAIADFSDPSLHFSDYYVLELGRTQYLTYYLITALLSKVLGVMAANKLVMVSAIVGTPYGLRWLLRALDRDERAAVLVMPLTWNAHLILGFVNFIAAIPLALACLALAIRFRQDGQRKQGIGLALLLVFTFYTHVVPFGFAALGATAILFGDGLRPTLERWLALVPAGLASLVWVVRSPAGQATLSAARGQEGAGPVPLYATVSESFARMPTWLTDVLPVDVDEKILAAYGVLVLAALTFGSELAARPVVARARTIVAALAPIAFAAYFVAPDSYDWIWPIQARFPLLAIIFTLATVKLPDRAGSHLLVALAAVLTIASVREVHTAFVAFDRDEFADLDRAIAVIPRGERVVGLIFDRGSRNVRFAPFIHSVAWYQASRGGAVMFSFADFPQSPLRFREDARPPRVGRRWEWTPERVEVDQELAWYHYALVRGGPGAIGSMPAIWQPLGTYGPWQVFRRARPVQ